MTNATFDPLVAGSSTALATIWSNSLISTGVTPLLKASCSSTAGSISRFWWVHLRLADAVPLSENGAFTRRIHKGRCAYSMSALQSIIAAFSEEQVERLTGLSKTQLRYWDRTGFSRQSLPRKISAEHIADCIPSRMLSRSEQSAFSGISTMYHFSISAKWPRNSATLRTICGSRRSFTFLIARSSFTNLERTSRARSVSGQYVIGVLVKDDCLRHSKGCGEDASPRPGQGRSDRRDRAL